MDKLEKILPNRWIFSLSNEIYTDPRGEVFEVRGVPPSVVTTSPSPEAEDSERFGRDISLAIEKLNPMQASRRIH
jgi:hypothetical protein